MRPLPWLTVAAVFVAATAVPLRPPNNISENEAATRDDIRTVIDAEARYQAVNGGYFDRLECLAAPENCHPSYKGPPMLSRELADMANRWGYRRSFHTGPFPPEGTPSECSGTSVLSYAYVAVPVRPGVTGVHSYCGDSTARLCHKSDGSAFEVVDGLCPKDCQPF
jgi:hypothetical protein